MDEQAFDSQLQSELTLEATIGRFLRSRQAKNRSQATIDAYRADLRQFVEWLHENNGVATAPNQVERADITDFLTELGRQGVSGVTRARKLAAIREYFRFLELNGQVAKSPAAGVETPKKERPVRPYFTADEYNRLLALAGSHPRDYAILQLFLQTGIRVSELCGCGRDTCNSRP